jgi:hypothetical protein
MNNIFFLLSVRDRASKEEMMDKHPKDKDRVVHATKAENQEIKGLGIAGPKKQKIAICGGHVVKEGSQYSVRSSEYLQPCFRPPGVAYDPIRLYLMPVLTTTSLGARTAAM